MGKSGSRTLDQLNESIVTCRQCPRLVKHREAVARVRRKAYQDQLYWGKPVTGFGDPKASLLIVGLAPGAHGANRTGRVFTGDSSGDFLFSALYRAGLSSQQTSNHRADGLRLHGCYISAAVRCAPPGNRPSMEERDRCRPFLHQELLLLKQVRVVLCLGHIAFEDFSKALEVRLGKFGHGNVFPHGGIDVLCSYHVSRQNTQTGRLTPQMFDDILKQARKFAGL